ncbi:DUF365 domain-containing protein [Methermicoccus shengliensis]|uniref:DUF365 domain-containing protein n=1 Tax=Methermicoccus shengliensis TaxID=660064 RepID=A0A832VZ89_9EURY|nr:DUF365 domain-containing protein [Methermicoccus shengliensis]
MTNDVSDPETVLEEYIKSQERWKQRRKGEARKRLWMAIELEDIKKYEKPAKPKSSNSQTSQPVREFPAFNHPAELPPFCSS